MVRSMCRRFDDSVWDGLRWRETTAWHYWEIAATGAVLATSYGEMRVQRRRFQGWELRDALWWRLEERRTWEMTWDWDARWVTHIFVPLGPWSWGDGLGRWRYDSLFSSHLDTIAGGGGGGGNQPCKVSFRFSSSYPRSSHMFRPPPPRKLLA